MSSFHRSGPCAGAGVQGGILCGGSLVRVDYPSFAQAAQAAWNAWVVPSYWPGTQKVDWFTNKLYPPCQTKEGPAYLAYGGVSDYVNVDSTTRSSSGAIGCTSTYNDVYIQLTCPAGGSLSQASDGQWLCINAPECPAPQVRDPVTGQCKKYFVTSEVTPALDAGKNAGASCPAAGNPVNPATGNKFAIETGYAGAGAYPLAFTRTYNSAALQDGPLGVGWQHGYARRRRVTRLSVSFSCGVAATSWSTPLASGRWSQS